MANTRITRSISSGSTTNKFTLSFWIKKSTISGSSDMWLFEKYNNGSARTWIRFNTDTGSPRLEVSEYTGTYVFRKILNRVFRDVGAYYHIHIEFNSTLGTEADRLKIYINGVQETSFATTNHPALNSTSIIANAGNQHFGYSENGNGNYFSGIMSHINFTDGYAYAPTAFGEYDANGVWKIKTSPSVTYGTNGFFILKDGNSVTDQSGNSNNFTVGGGTLTNTEDSPSNVFATLNPLAGSTDATFIAGNTTAYFGTASSRSILTSTLGAVSGKYYWECKIGGNVSPNNATLGVGLSSSYTADSNPVGYKSDSWGYKGWDGTVFNNSSSVGGTWSTFGDGDIIGVAVNLDNEQGGLNKLYFSKNGVWQNGADPSNFTSATGVVGITKPENGDTGFLFAQFGDGGSSATPRFEVNFGNGYFQQTAVSSAGTNASGNGVFEYDVPTGYTALSTKGLNL